MRRWLILIPLILLLAALALTVRAWLPPLLAFVGANTELIQGLEATVQIVLWLGAAAVALVSYLTGRRQKSRLPEVAPQAEAAPEARVRQEMSGPGPGVQAGRDTEVGRDLVLGDNIGSQVNTAGGPHVEGNITIIGTQAAERFLKGLQPRLSTAALRQVTAAYYDALLDRHRYLGFRGMGVSDRIPLKLPLLDLYVPLKARVELPEGETWRRGLSVAGRQLPAGEGADLSGRMSEPVPVLDLLQKNDGLIILGDPGAGKTTFLKFLALKLALGEGEALGLSDRLPVLAPLSEYANTLGGSASLVRLDDFIVQHLVGSGADGTFEEIFRAALDAGQALILLDGLDEVKDLRLRETVVKQVAAFFAFQRRKGNKFVVTSRIVGYREARLSAELPSECTLIDFDDDEIAAFVARWTAALECQAQGATPTAATDAARERHELLDAIHRNPSVRRLAANPLLLTILAMMKRQGVTLPERRVELYDQYVTTLLSTWNRARGLGRPPSHDLDVVQTMRILAPLALWMHEVNPGVGLVKREDLRRKLMALYTESGEPQPDRAAQQFLEDVREYAGLLLERGPEEFGFIHLTFEEYLAAVAIALAGQGDCRPIFERLAAHVGDPAWREVAQLTVGYLGIRQQLPKVAGGVVEALVTEQPGAPGEAVVLAGEAVLDAWPGGVPPASKAQVVDALIPTMQARHAAVPAPLRRRAGLLLGRLGWLPPDLDDFVEVPAGEFLYGDDKQKRRIPYHYWIGKYPVTNAQYARFMADKGYERQELWSADGWRWRTGAQADLSSIDNKDLREAYIGWLASRPQEKRNQPFFWDDPERANSIFPVVGVTWFEAEAYTNWLHTRPAELRLGETMPKDHRVRLATETEWERAARGTDGREYPWSGDFDFANANVAKELGPGIGTTAVCTYPQGISPVGAWDMSGNVWEWTHSLLSPNGSYRVLRGGSWLDSQRNARCASRDRYIPVYFNDVIGFRVVVSLSDSGF